MKIIICLCAIALSTSCAFSQSVTNVQAKQFGNNIEVAFTVDAVNEDEPYNIQIAYTAKNTGTSKLMTHVYGDVGKDVSGSGDKKIIWDVLREVDSFEGDYAFKVILIPTGETIPTTNKAYTEGATEGKVDKFVASIKEVSMQENNVLIKFSLLNTDDNENFKVHITKSKIIGPNGKNYLAKSGKQGSKDRYGFMNVVLQKGLEVEVFLLFDYVPEDIKYLKSFEIIRYIGMISSQSILFTNITINK